MVACIMSSCFRGHRGEGGGGGGGGEHGEISKRRHCIMQSRSHAVIQSFNQPAYPVTLLPLVLPAYYVFIHFDYSSDQSFA